MNIKELFENSFELVEDFILNCVGDKIENISEIPKMLSNIKYLDNKNSLISQTTKCEILDIEDYHILKYSINNRVINIIFNVSFIMQTFVNSKYIWRIQCMAESEINIKNDPSIDFEKFDPDNYKKYIDLIKINNLKYHDAECDTL